MEKSKIERINFLAKKSKTKGLTDEERSEQQALRDEYRAEFRKNLEAQLDNTYCIDENGNKVKVSRYAAAKKKESKQ